ncbi:putative receptor-like protein kinase [Ananas comosus]|uniref:Putative receptor-like protein kinase n=1 Tax=Ananas comosus TaxID=4615 RepID=A0A199VKF9_ANACO|nr:putative receptor-like protein kinase [Ananas comosus]
MSAAATCDSSGGSKCAHRVVAAARPLSSLHPAKLTARPHPSRSPHPGMCGPPTTWNPWHWRLVGIVPELPAPYREARLRKSIGRGSTYCIPLSSPPTPPPSLCEDEEQKSEDTRNINNSLAPLRDSNSFPQYSWLKSLLSRRQLRRHIYLRDPRLGLRAGLFGAQRIHRLQGNVAAFFLYGLTAAIPRIMAWQRRDAGNSELDLEEERHLGYSFLGEVVGLPKRIPYRELKEATRNFQTPIGRGGSGSVFKGILGDGLPVAVKRIEGELRGEREFRSEITAILSVQHVSLVRIVGYCIIPRSYRFLVYEYFENGSLDNWIFPKAGRENNCLNWALRYQVAIDVAKALAYLHHQCRQRILHLDVKPENILVDENFRAHVTDFGISRLLGVDETSVITTVRGTRGYLAPEWFAGGGICEKSDVYGYGMVLFELMSGRRNINFIDEGGHISQRRWSYFPKNASEKMKGGNLMELVDQRLIGSGGVKEEEVKTLVYVAFWCIQDKPELRPSMEMVANMLQGYVAVGVPPDTKIFLAESPAPTYLELSSGSTMAGSTTSDGTELPPISMSSSSASNQLDVAAFFLYGLTATIPRIMAWQRRDAGNSELDLEEERHLGYSFFGEVVGLPKRIPYRELKEATRNFQTPIGRGGSGSVFKGILGDGLPVAVKRIEGELRGEREFRSEITAILSVQHVSLVRIVGYCIIPRSYRFLVYEYFENGSLDNWIFPKAGRENNCLNWALRYQVAIDVAKALAYLHHQCRQRILHLDVKPENILVDENFRAHVTDFGISRLLGVDETSVITTVRGTRGYLAPEWFLGGGICEKSDVYGYGMVLFELMSGRRNINFIDEGGHISQRRWSYFPKNASEKMKGGNLMELVDQRLIGSGDVKEEEVKTLVYVAFWCIQEKPELRPSMEMVANMLQGYVTVGMPPDTKIFLAETPAPTYLEHSSGSTMAGSTTSDGTERPPISMSSFSASNQLGRSACLAGKERTSDSEPTVAGNKFQLLTPS